ncbi:hypothetical protein GGS23DRAFT_561241 [Durotheca rogersii]|uniref:uncharacterized protein n=1 Tax=Durotheca rogersii TaxID=419775 RepID=UPI00221F8FDF|nr:uncharacterized protein GGS23DRAFT_561241 [Durotheca rogersii]KAI5864657.1 hypothetical protein GGS23DRAFT_561241 [Durotheca rogersii]
MRGLGGLAPVTSVLGRHVFLCPSCLSAAGAGGGGGGFGRWVGKYTCATRAGCVAEAGGGQARSPTRDRFRRHEHTRPGARIRLRV